MAIGSVEFISETDGTNLESAVAVAFATALASNAWMCLLLPVDADVLDVDESSFALVVVPLEVVIFR